MHTKQPGFQGGTASCMVANALHWTSCQRVMSDDARFFRNDLDDAAAPDAKALRTTLSEAVYNALQARSQEPLHVRSRLCSMGRLRWTTDLVPFPAPCMCAARPRTCTAQGESAVSIMWHAGDRAGSRCGPTGRQCLCGARRRRADVPAARSGAAAWLCGPSCRCGQRSNNVRGKYRQRCTAVSCSKCV
jgi:hypothetical protein